MKKYLTYLLVFAFLNFASFANAQSPCNIKTAIKLGENYLINQVSKDQYYVSCESNNSDIQQCPFPVPFQNTGKAFSAFFIISALQKDTPPSVRNKILELLHQGRISTLGLSANLHAPVWGYFGTRRIVLMDADDTSFALQTLDMLGVRESIAGLDLFYINKYNTYATYYRRYPSLFRNNPPKIEHIQTRKTNSGVHSDVISNVYNVYHSRGLDHKINYKLIADFQSEQGYWNSFFYPGYYYSTYLSMKLLCSAHKLPENVAKGINFLVTSQNQDGSWGKPGNVYETALALNTLLTCQSQNDNVITNGIKYILDHQAKDGYWASNNVLWFFIFSDDPFVKWHASDVNHVVTTALTVKALKAYLNSNLPSKINFNCPNE